MRWIQGTNCTQRSPQVRDTQTDTASSRGPIAIKWLQQWRN